MKEKFQEWFAEIGAGVYALGAIALIGVVGFVGYKVLANRKMNKELEERKIG